MARQLGLPTNTKGVVVTDVQPGSTAAEAGLQKRDVIQEVNRQQMTSLAEFHRALSQGSNQPVLSLINRGGSTLHVMVERS